MCVMQYLKHAYFATAATPKQKRSKQQARDVSASEVINVQRQLMTPKAFSS